MSSSIHDEDKLLNLQLVSKLTKDLGEEEC